MSSFHRLRTRSVSWNDDRAFTRSNPMQVSRHSTSNDSIRETMTSTISRSSKGGIFSLPKESLRMANFWIRWLSRSVTKMFPSMSKLIVWGYHNWLIRSYTNQPRTSHQTSKSIPILTNNTMITWIKNEQISISINNHSWRLTECDSSRRSISLSRSKQLNTIVA